MILTIFAPEVILSKNLGDLSMADSGVKKLKRYAEADGVEWSKTHDLFANMGGFVIRSNMMRTEGNDAENSRSPTQSQQEPMVYALLSRHIFLLRDQDHLLDDKLPDISIGMPAFDCNFRKPNQTT